MVDKNMTSKNSLKNIPNYLDKIKLETRERRRNILYLILGYLKENLLETTAEALHEEAQLDHTYQVCENVELDVILQEYQSYYYTKFQKYPKIIRKLDEMEQKPLNRSAKRKNTKNTVTSAVERKEKSESNSESDVDFQFEIISLNNSKSNSEDNVNRISKTFVPELENYSTENREIINKIANQVISNNAKIRWTDCLGLESAIETLKESSIYPLQYPELFNNLIPWKGILLHGPPGTGKTLLAKALVSEGCTTFFNVTNSTFVTKWRGESEKMIKYLFDMAKQHAPSTIFFDEIDALACGTKDAQHEASKRFKSELLTQLDGISSTNEHVLVLASTNSPWDLDNALLRRFEKRILIDMPSKGARKQILKHCLQNNAYKILDQELEEFGNLTENYSGSDIKIVSKEITMSIVRGKLKSLEKGNTNIPSKIITFSDVKQALQKVRSSTNSVMCKKYYQWQNEHGAL